MNKKMMAIAASVLMSMSAAACSKPAEPAAPAATAAATAVAETSEADMKAALDRHVAGVKAGNIDAILADYADDATMVLAPGDVAPKGALVGKTEVRKFFVWLTGPEILPGAQSMNVTTEKVGPNTMYFHFTQFPGTPKEVQGFDIYVFRAGKIVFQTTFVTPK